MSQKTDSRFETKTFKIRHTEYMFKQLSKISKKTGLTEEDIIGNGLMNEVLKYPSITGIKRRGKRWDL